MELEFKYINPKTGVPSPLIAEDIYEIVVQNAERQVAQRCYSPLYFPSL